MTEVVSTRVPNELAKDLAKIEEVEKADRATIVRKLLARAVEEWKKEYALSLYREDKISLWRAARLAGITLREMMDFAVEKNVPFKYSEKDLEEDLTSALSEK
mgnify:CR=1 FL=1